MPGFKVNKAALSLNTAYLKLAETQYDSSQSNLDPRRDGKGKGKKGLGLGNNNSEVLV